LAATVDRWEIRKMKVSLAGKVAIVTGETIQVSGLA
jgi:hypothetical protein